MASLEGDAAIRHGRVSDIEILDDEPQEVSLAHRSAAIDRRRRPLLHTLALPGLNADDETRRRHRTAHARSGARGSISAQRPANTQRQQPLDSHPSIFTNASISSSPAVAYMPRREDTAWPFAAASAASPLNAVLVREKVELGRALLHVQEQVRRISSASAK